MLLYRENINVYVKTGKFWICLKKLKSKESESKLVCKLKNKNLKIMQNKKTLYLSSNTKNIVLYWKLLTLNLLSLKTSWYYRFKLIGVGYKIIYDKKTHTLQFFYGYSNPNLIKIPSSIKFFESSQRQTYGISCIDKMIMYNFLNKLEKLRKFDKYKGKGLIFENKFYLRKTSKKNEK